MYFADTIAAIATPPGTGGIGIVRISGPAARDIASRVFQHRQGRDWTSHHLYRGSIVDTSGRPLDDALAVLMASPHSYTGEDVVELQCHGGAIVLRRVLAAVLGSGARLAEPGEFTKRAFLNGCLDLAQAEAVVDLINARGDAAAGLALEQMRGTLSRELADIRENLIRLKALLETQIDFSEEDVQVDTEELLELARRCEEEIAALIRSFHAGKIARDGLRVAIAGKPNVGKSSLLNAFLREDRAIVSALPGTTRDTIEEAASFEGIPVVLTDTAGLRATERADPVERIGIQRTTAALAGTEIALLVFDAASPLDDDDRAVLALQSTQPQLIVMNKSDLAPTDRAEIELLRRQRRLVDVSAKTGAGLDVLRRTVVDLAAALPAGTETPVITRIRHRDLLAKAMVSLRLTRASIADRQPPDVVAVDVQDAIDLIGEITGVISNDEVLDRIFTEFCIGK